jgi:hypothetical protein
MANVKISELAAASTALAGTEVLPIVQSSATVKVSVANLTAGRSVAASAFVASTIGAASGNALSLQSNGTTNVTLDTSGRLGIGTTSPQQRLHVQDATQIRGVVSSGSNSIQFWRDSTPTFVGAIGCGTPATGLADAILFETFTGSWQERMRITSGGDLLVGTTTSSGKITSSSASTSALSAIISASSQLTTVGLNIQKSDNNSTTSNWFQAFTINAGATGSGIITANGASAAAFGAFSDSRLKENIVNLPSQLDNIMALRPVEFDYVKSMGGGHQIGFIAQEVQVVFPDLVSAGPNGMLTLTDMNKNDARLIKAMQEQQALIEALTQRITALEAK